MYKEVIISTIIIIAIIIGNILTQNYTTEAVYNINQKLEEKKEKIIQVNESLEKKEISEEQQEKEKEDLKSDINEIISKWKEKYKILAYYIEHDELEKVNTELVSLKGNIESKEYGQGISDLERCIFILEHIKDKFALKIKNIF